MEFEMKTKHFFKYPNPRVSPFTHSNRRRLRVADILLADHDHADADFMAAVKKPHHPPSLRCLSPRRFVSWLLAGLRPARDLRRQNVAGHSATLTDEPEARHDSRKLLENDASFKLGVSCGLLYQIAACKNELSKMVELRKEMEMFLQNVKGELQSKDSVLKPLKYNDALALSITDIQEISSSSSHIPVHSQTPCVQPESDGSVVHNGFLEYNLSEKGDCAKEINELQAEFEVELQRLQMYLDEESAFEDQQERVKVIVEDSHSESHSSTFTEIIMEPQGASSDVSFGVPPFELERRLHELLESRLEERITELESALECTAKKLTEKEIEVTWWKDTAQLISQHVPETSRFTFRLDPEIVLKLSQAIG